ncbi:DUF6966 domain-containing protein [Pseudomonas oryzihabitans]|uniref:DUF6966 domain-containing protein n=1 Tax=Pseudomonas oryzihabitans TaxID=47885 RepID=UPI0028962561|nr:hypothetical protein [Pseudomonas oryzihabitans]MDT3722887.1 hypothetical protein [Pseudomonas oryzihabitans]
MGQKTEELIDVLEQIIKVLENDGELHWSRWMRKAQGRLIDSDYSGISYLLSAYGGMGSFNDLVLGQNFNEGRFSWKPDYVEMNNTLHELRERAAQLAYEIQRLQ